MLCVERSQSIFTLGAMQKHIKFDHSARDLPHGSWVSINFRGHGSGNRAAASPKYDCATKEEKVKTKLEEIQLLLLQLGNLNNAAANPIAHHIEMAIKQKKTLIEETLVLISIENLQKLQTHVSSNNNEQSRIEYLAKFIFAQDFRPKLKT